WVVLSIPTSQLVQFHIEQFEVLNFVYRGAQNSFVGRKFVIRTPTDHWDVDLGRGAGTVGVEFGVQDFSKAGKPDDTPQIRISRIQRNANFTTDASTGCGERYIPFDDPRVEEQRYSGEKYFFHYDLGTLSLAVDGKIPPAPMTIDETS